MGVIWYPFNPQGVVTHYMWEYLVGASLGGFLAGVFYHLHEKMFDIMEEERRERVSSDSAKIHPHEAEMYQNNTKGG